jgi:5-methylcytosine-specific restriction endonuclease McrA
MTTMTSKAMQSIKRQMMVEIQQSAVNRRCGSIVKHQNEKADKLKIARPNYSADALRAFVSPVIGTACKYCGKKITPKNFELDHETPLNRGGQFTLDNTAVIDNSCNKKKGALTAIEFRALLDFLKGFVDQARADVLTRLGIGGQWKR